MNTMTASVRILTVGALCFAGILAGSSVRAAETTRSTAASATAVTLDVVDKHLLSALVAMDQEQRKEALRAAQQALDAIPAASNLAPDGRSVPFKDEVVKRAGDAAQMYRVRAKRSLREALMLSVWNSPVGGISSGDLDALEHVREALRLLRQTQEVEEGKPESLSEMQNVYWRWLMDHRTREGVGCIALADRPDAMVLDQRVHRDPEGRLAIYQLVGSPDKTLQWRAVPGRALLPTSFPPKGIEEAADQEMPLWIVFIVDGPGLGTITAQRDWIDVLRKDVEVLVVGQGDLETVRQKLPSEWNTGSSETGVQVTVSTKEELDTNALPRNRLCVVQAKTGWELGCWPLATLEGRGRKALQAMVDQLVATGREERIKDR